MRKLVINFFGNKEKKGGNKRRLRLVFFAHNRAKKKAIRIWKPIVAGNLQPIAGPVVYRQNITTTQCRAARGLRTCRCKVGVPDCAN